MNEPIAVIGMSCRFPQADNVDEFWQLLINGVDAISDIPPDRFDVNTYHSVVPKAPGKIASRQGGFLRQVDAFDAMFFGIPPREAVAVDPQQRLLLETAWEALEDAGQVPEQISGSKTGVFVGMWTNDYEDRMYAASENINLYTTTGGGRYAASGRLSYFFNFNGPSLTLDTACSSSLVAMHLAVQSLWNGESTMALVGGVNLILIPQISIGYSRSGMLSPDGRCKFGDASANGYVRSEGVGVVVLKPLGQALVDGDAVHAVIRGSAVNNDGKSSELLVAPSPDTQAVMLRDAYRAAGVNPADVHYVEAHGTGTRVGDPVELTALGRVLGDGRASDQPCLVGSVKTNIGHTEAASGIAGFIKAVLCLKHRVIPPSLHLHEPNPGIPWDELPLSIPQTMTPWPKTNGPLYAGVNSFGVTGTNAHVVLEAAPEVSVPRSADQKSAYLLPLSARHPQALRELARAYASLNPDIPLHDLAFTVSTRKTHHEYRLGLAAPDMQSLRAQLVAFADDESSLEGYAPSDEQPVKPRIGFVFSGQGGQWVGMGRRLAAQEPVFRAALERCEAAMQPYVDWSLMGELNAPEGDSRLEEIDIIQPVIFAVQVALAELWRSWGIEPGAVIGHSMGEVAAACVAGILSLEDAAHVICRRSQLMKQVSGRGAMALVELPSAEVEQALLSAAYENQLGVAVVNGPTSTVISGDPSALEALVGQLEAQDVFCRFVKVDVAAHSPHMDELRPLLVDDLKELRAQQEQVSIFSTVAGGRLSGAQFDAAYWGKNLRQPVRFAAAVEQALAEGFDTFIEIGPHPVLLAAIERGYGSQAHLTTLPSMRRDEDERMTLLNSLGALYSAGYDVRWSLLYPEGGRVVRLPAYPWQREHFWIAEESGSMASSWFRRLVPGSRFALLGHHLQSHNGTHYWETDVDLKTFPYLADHKVQGNMVFPAAAYAEMMLAAAQEVFGEGAHSLSNLIFREALFLQPDETKAVQVMATPQSSDGLIIHIYARQGDGWVQHASGNARRSAPEMVNAEPPANLDTQMEPATGGDAHYAIMEQRALHYGPTFQGIEALATRDCESRAALRLHDDVIAQMASYQIHPSLLDACFQTLLATLPDGDFDTYLPVNAAHLTLYQPASAGAALIAHAVRADSADDLLGDVFLLDERGGVLACVDGLRMKRLERATSQLENWLYEVKWIPAVLSGEVHTGGPGNWLIFADSQGIGAALASRLEAGGEQVVLAHLSETYQTDAREYGLNPYQEADFQRLLDDVSTKGLGEWRGVIYLWALDAGDDDLPEAGYWVSIGALHLVQRLISTEKPTRLWLVTRGAQPVTGDVTAPAQAGLWGFGAVLGNEHPELHPIRIDLDAQADGVEMLFEEIQTVHKDDQIAYRNHERYTARLASHTIDLPDMRGETRMVHPAQQSFRAEVTQPGVLDRLRLRAMTRQAPGAGEVEIEVMATGLNFMNVMSALGTYPGYDNGVGPLGIECAGRIVRVGPGVEDWQPGDEVVAVAFHSLATHATTDARLIARKPESLSFVEAATIPIVFLTAWYSLHYLARMEAGERVLIHAGAGGVGLAAIQLAHRAGAQVWATAGTPEKRDYLRSIGVHAVMDSRSLAFADHILESTSGEGVDIVLNSLAGEAIARGLAILRPYGRFVEIGKRDIYENNAVGLLPFSKNLAYFAVDLDRMSRERPAQVGAMLREVMALAEAGDVQPIPVTVYSAAEIVNAFRYMAQGKHTGKLVIVPGEAEVPVFMTASSPVREDGSYLITGGLGGLGLTVAQWLAAQGARQIVLTGRRAPGETAAQVIEDLRASGVTVQIAQVDVTDQEAVEQLAADIRQNLLPLSGIVHAAGVLDDGMLLQLDAARFRRAMSPKVSGAWHLHNATRNADLDWFVLFSSVVPLLGAAGQANYAAGNAFMDGLAYYRRSMGLPAQSINWGPWSDVGLAAAEANRAGRLAARGLGSLTPQAGIEALSALLGSNVTQAAVMAFDAAQWVQTYPAAANSSLLSGLLKGAESAQAADGAASSAQDIWAALRAAEIGPARYKLLQDHLSEQVGYVLGIAPSLINPQRALRNMGLDSLMTLELRNRLESSLGLKLPATLVFNYPTIAALVTHLAERMDIPLEAASTIEAEAVSEDAQVDSLEGLSQSEVEALLMEELSSLDDLLKGN